MQIASWNVNSLKIRLDHVLAWLDQAGPDVLLLQELKMKEEAIPADRFTAAGYHIAAVGQGGYNGVAIVSRTPAEITATALPGDPGDDQARYLEARIDGVRVASLYLPNGNPVDGDKFPYKLAWMDRLIAHARDLLAGEEAVVLGGDYNVCPTDDDVYDPTGWAEDALCHPESRRRFHGLCHLGYTEAWRALHDDIAYTFWDYQAGRWSRDEGLRIDHLLLSPQAADRLETCDIDRGPRGWERPSDHTPIWCRLSA